MADYGSAAADGADPADLNRAFGNLTPGQRASNVAGISTSANPVFLYAGGSNGFAAQYQNTIPDAGAGSPNNGDQGHHFAAFFQIGFAYGAGFGDALARIFEGGEMFFNNLAGSVGPLNSGDIALGMAAVQIGADLASGRISTSGAAGRIRSLCNK